MKTPKPPCETCGNPVKRNDNRFCKATCIRKSPPLPPCRTCGGEVRRKGSRSIYYCYPECGQANPPTHESNQPPFWTLVDKNGPVSPDRPDLGPCWIWLGRTDQAGYGQYLVRQKIQRPLVKIRAHRHAYDLTRGISDPSLHVDHLCRVHACVNPDHLEMVTSRENNLRGVCPAAINARKTHCLRGHVFDDENTYRVFRKDGRAVRGCRACIQIRSRTKSA